MCKEEVAEKSVRAFERRLAGSPYGMPQMMSAIDFYLGKPKQILIAGQRGSDDTPAILRQIQKRFLPHKIVVLADGGQAHQRLSASLEILNNLRPIDGKATAYICENYICNLLTNQPSVVAELLSR